MARSGNVLHLVERWLPPSETFVHDLVHGVRRDGPVVSYLPPANLDRFPQRPLVRLPGHLIDHLPPVTRRRVTTAMLLAVAARYGVGVVHVHHGYRAGAVYGLVTRRQIPLVVSLHGHDVTGFPQQWPGAYGSILERADAVVVPSRYLAEHAVALGAREEALRVIPSGIDTSWFRASPLPADPEVLFVGRFVEKKGLDVLAKAWPTVRAALPSARLRMLGFGPLEPLAREMGDGTEVLIAPDRSAVRDAMRRARVVVSPSHTASDDAVESLLLVNLEAQASGRPVVTTDHGGIPEYVCDGETALVVPEGDADALAAALVRVLSDDGLATRLGASGPAWARRFDVRTTTETLDALYDELADRGGGAAGRMREYWDSRARENAVWYVDTSLSRDRPDMERFFATGNVVASIALDDAPVRPEHRELAVEIGSGLGRVALALADRFDRVVGVDISEEMVRRARELVDHPRVTFELGDGAGLGPIGDASADLVVSFTVFQHIPEIGVIERYIAEAARVLRPGGVLAFQWNNLPGSRLWAARRTVLATLQRSGLRPERHGRHAAEFLGSRVPLARISCAVRDAGLELNGTRELGSLYAWAWAQKPRCARAAGPAATAAKSGGSPDASRTFRATT